MRKDLGNPVSTVAQFNQYDWAFLFIAPLLSTLIKNLHTEAKPVEKAVHGIGSIATGAVLGGYLRIEAGVGLWLTTLAVICFSPVLFSFVVVVSDNSVKLAKTVFDLLTDKIIQFVKDFSFKKNGG